MKENCPEKIRTGLFRALVVDLLVERYGYDRASAARRVSQYAEHVETHLTYGDPPLDLAFGIAQTDGRLRGNHERPAAFQADYVDGSRDSRE